MRSNELRQRSISLAAGADCSVGGCQIQVRRLAPDVRDSGFGIRIRDAQHASSEVRTSSKAYDSYAAVCDASA